ncbi:Hypothethical protein [Burkholderia sp. IT-111MI5]
MRNTPLQTRRAALGGYTIEGPYVRAGRAGWLRRLIGKIFRAGA